MEMEIFESEKGKSVRANKNFREQEILVEFTGTIKDTPDKHSLQIAEGKHLSGIDWPEYLNHSCNPNCYVHVDTVGVWLMAKRDIKLGEELTFDYNTTEYDMANPFICACCGKIINGYKYLTDEERKKIDPWVLPYLRGK
jgi:SET domain